MVRFFYDEHILVFVAWIASIYPSLTIFHRFCVLFLETTGSCNDVLKIEIKANAPPVKLQRGPKSYAYGPFVNALELCYDYADGSHASRGDTTTCWATVGGERRMVDDGDLEDFLDSCDDDSDNEDDIVDEDDNDDDEDDTYDDHESSEANDTFGDEDIAHSRFRSMIKDIRAMDALRDVLLKVKTGLINNSLAKRIRDDDCRGDVVLDDAERYCTILINSEVQTVDFYLAVGRECRRRLMEHVRTLPLAKESTVMNENFTMTDSVLVDDIILSELANEQVISIANAFAAIRYSLV
jgi:hypothetical protein